MNSSGLKKFWAFLKEDTWQSWLVSLVLAFVIIKFIFFPVLSFTLGTSLPLVVVESCSMYHQSDFDNWWAQGGAWYENQDISKSLFTSFPFRSGLNKGDIVIVSGHGSVELGDVIIFESSYKYPLIHRLVTTDVLSTKGDNNVGQLSAEVVIPEEAILGKAIVRVPALGWIKLIFFEGSKSSGQRGFCK